MTKYALLKNQFTSGQLSPLMNRRSDFTAYQNGASILQNFTVLPQGGITRRPGSLFVAEVKDSTKKTRLIPFRFSLTQAYVVEAGNTYMRFYTDDGQVISGTPVEVTSPYLETELFDIQFTQSADIVTMCHPNHAPRDLTRTSATTFTLTRTPFTDGPYLAENTTSTTLTPSHTSGTGVTLTASAPLFDPNDTTGTGGTGDFDRFVKINGGHAKITGYTSSTVVTIDIIEDFSSGSASTEWSLGAYSSTTGFPRAVVYHQQRRFYGGTTTEPEKIWGSAVDDYPTFTPGTNDADAVSFTLAPGASGEISQIYWLASGNELRIGTEGGCRSLDGGSDKESITPTNVNAKVVNSIRCKTTGPLQLDRTTLFLQRNGKFLRQLGYSFQEDALIAPDLTLTSEDILGDIGDLDDLGGTQLAYQLEPYSTVWISKNDGGLASFNYIPEQKIFAWANHVFGGTDVEVESVATSPITGQDRVWVIVKRTVDGSTVRYVEKLDKTYRNRDVKLAVFADSAVTFSGNQQAATLTLGATSGDSVTFTAGSGVFSSGDVGKIIYPVQGDGITGRAEIIGFTSSTVVTCRITETFNTTSYASNGWTLSSNTLSGLNHLEGESVTYIGDGGAQGTAVVSSGSITLSDQFTFVTAGLQYDSIMTTMPIDAGGQFGTGFGFRNQSIEVEFNIFESTECRVGRTTAKLSELLKPSDSDTIEEGLPNQTDLFQKTVQAGVQDEQKVTVVAQDPLPLTLLSMTIKGETSDVF